MCTVDTFLETERSDGEDEAVLIVPGATDRLGGKGYLTATAIEATAAGTILLFAEIAANGSEFEDKWKGLIPTLNRDNRIWVITASDRTQRTYVRPGRRASNVELDEEALKLQIAGSDLLYISAEHIDIVRTVVQAWHTADARPPIALNPCIPFQDRMEKQPWLLQDLLVSSEFVLMNEFESDRLANAGWPASRFRTAELVVITSGEAGGRYSTDGGKAWTHFHATPVPRAGVTAAGAGDVFNGTLLARLVVGGTVPAAIGAAADAAAAHILSLRTELRP
jgi:sugar/nucleoside kinase (ribokinase family)